MRFLASFVAFACMILVNAQFTPLERRGINDALLAGALQESDLAFPKRIGNVPYALNLVGVALDKPLEGAEAIMALHAKADRSIASLLRTALEEGFGESLPDGGLLDATMPGNVAIPEELREPVAILAAAVSDANKSIREATSNLSAEEKRLLIEALPQWAAIGTDVKFEFVNKPIPNRSELYELISKVELKKIRVAALKLAKAVDEEMPKLRGAIQSRWVGTSTFNLQGVIVEVSGLGNDTHKASNAGLCIDLGGQNQYTGRYGAGIGYSSVLIDFGTETITDMPDASGGVGLLGIGLAYFMGAKPDLYSKNLSFGAGLAGVGAAFVEQASRMDSRAVGQGFGMFGVGILCLGKGSDSLKLGYLGQGASTGGGIGWLYDAGGNDRYRVGGIVLDDQKNSLSRAQGFSGVLPGGIGLLTDVDGNDLYDIGMEGQSCAIGFGIGSLYDYKGDDTYIAFSRAQSFSQSEGVATFYDLEGDDISAVRRGECHGMATERSVAFYLDRAGSDLVTAQSSSPGNAQEGSVAFYIDGGGADRFAGPVGVGVKLTERLGIGMFLDLGGDNQFVDGPMSGTISLHGSGGVAASFNFVNDTAEIKPISPGSLQATSIEIDAWWTQVNAGGAKSLFATRQLLGAGLPAFKRFCEAFAIGSSPLAKRAAAMILTQFGGAKTILVEKAASGTAESRSVFFEVAAYAKVGDLKNLIGAALQSDSTRLSATKYAAALGAKEFIEPISSLVLGADALTAQQAVFALCSLGDDKMVSTMEALMNSGDLMIRQAAIEFVARYPRGFELGKTLLSRTDEKSQLQGVELLSKSKDVDAVRLCGAGLNSSSATVKIKAMTVLNGRVPEAYRKRVIELMSDSNAVVAAVAKGIDLGR
jgi:hypothetical protein